MNSLQSVTILLLITTATTYNPIRVCYYTSWSQYRHGIGKFMPSDIDAQLCTHLIYAFAKLGDNHELTTYEWNDEILYAEFNGLKEQNPNLKTLIATGGWTVGSGGFSEMVTNPTLRHKFVRTSVAYVRTHGFDGLDMDWEYPALKGGIASDKDNFIILLKELQDEIKTDAENHPNKPKLLLTAAVAAGKSNIDKAYDIPAMSIHLDFINLMSYDFHGAWDKVAEHNSALYARADESDKTYNIDWAARYWLAKGTPKEKLIIGLAAYGRHYKLTNTSKAHIGTDIRGAGKAGTYTEEAGFLAYYEVCSILLKDGVIRVWEQEQMVPYMVDGDEWIGYDDEESFAVKLNYTRDNGYGGAMVWSIALDDFNKNCAQSTRKYPLVSLMGMILGGYTPPATVSPPSTKLTSTEVVTGSTTKHTDITCAGLPDGFYPHPSECSVYYQCWSNTMHGGTCLNGLVWNQALTACDYPRNVNCSESTTETSTTETSTTEASTMEASTTEGSTTNVSQTTVYTQYPPYTVASYAIKPHHSIIIILLWISVHAIKCT